MSLPSLNNSNNKLPGLPTFNMPPIDESHQNENNGFEEVDLEDVSDYYDDNEDIYEEVKRIEEPSELPTMDNSKDEDYFVEDEDYYPEYEEDLKEETNNKFIDKKGKRIVPLGGKKSKRKIVSSEFDSRQNTLVKIKIVRFLIMCLLITLFFVGLKNTFIPNHVYTDNQIRQFAKEGSGNTGFPEHRGIALVENFMDSYLTFDRSKPELIDILAHYYAEGHGARMGHDKLNMSGDVNAKQKVIIAPRVYEVNLKNEYSGQFLVSAYVSDTDGSEVVGTYSNGRWLSFAVNVYYDVVNNTMAITRDSPSIIPSYKIASPAKIPERYPLGGGEIDTDILPTLNPTINGFIEAYANASVASHESIVQYIDDKNNIKLFSGFGGTVALDGPPANSIKKVVYNNPDGDYRVEVTVNWIDVAASMEKNQVKYTAKYIMIIKTLGNGKYAVSDFTPYTYYK